MCARKAAEPRFARSRIAAVLTWLGGDHWPEPGEHHEQSVRAARGGPTIPTIPDVTKAAARWIRPLVPTFVTRAIDTTKQPLRSARQVFVEVEEITFSLRRTRKVTAATTSFASSSKPERKSLSGTASPDIQDANSGRS